MLSANRTKATVTVGSDASFDSGATLVVTLPATAGFHHVITNVEISFTEPPVTNAFSVAINLGTDTITHKFDNSTGSITRQVYSIGPRPPLVLKGDAGSAVTITCTSTNINSNELYVVVYSYMEPAL